MSTFAEGQPPTAPDNTTFLYFAYGSNMLTRRLTERTQFAEAEGIGYLNRHRLAFDKVSTDGSGKANVTSGNETDRVYGVLFRIHLAEEAELDRHEGLNRGYRKDSVQIRTDSGTVTANIYRDEQELHLCSV